MKIKLIRWKNFNSYGNKLNELLFDDNHSLNQIIGKNGAGKSTIIEVITYALYGTVSGKSNSILVNRINKSMFVEIEFENDNKIVNIKRGISPDLLEVSINGNKDIGDIAGKKNVQNIIQNYIQIPQNIFNNLVALNVNRFMSFIRLTPTEKRQVIDKLFNLDDINTLYELLKLDLKTIKKELLDLDKHLKWYRDENTRTLSDIDELLELNSKSDNTKELELKESLDILDEKLQEIKSKTEKLAIKEKELKKQEKEHHTKINNIEYKIKETKRKLSVLDNDECPTCGSDLKSDFHNSNRKEYEKIIENSKKEYDALKLEEKEFNDANDKIYGIRRKIESTTREILSEKQDIRNKINQIDRDVQIKIETLKGNIDKNTEKINQLDIDVIEKRNELDFLEKVGRVLDEDGFKKLIFKNLLPTFNNQIKKFTEAIGIPYDLAFDDNFNVMITHLGTEIDIRGLSTGENKKLDLIVVFSLIVLLKIKFKNINLLFLDEVFSGLDVITQQHVIEILNKISEKLKLHSFVINHSDLAVQNFHNIYEIEKKCGFSVIDRVSQTTK